MGIGLPAAVPDAEMSVIDPRSAPDASAGFDFVGVIDPLINDNLDPLAAAASTAWVSAVVNVCWRGNPVLPAKQLASVARLSAGLAPASRPRSPRWSGAGGRVEARTCPARRHGADIVHPGPPPG
ncbi:MAG TPA: hypothetical protein VHF45_02245 [Thermoleophilaceae bacterium]|nr:hypothetical protein [Thermoleophilaceae bacterium]